MRVLKFGGSSLSDADKIQSVCSIILKYAEKDKDLIVVASAQAGVTNQLVEITQLIPEKIQEAESILKSIEQRHLSAAKLHLPVSNQPGAMAEIISMCNDLSDIVRGAAMVGEVTLRTRDLILSFGERLSAFLLSQVLSARLKDVFYCDTRELIRTDSDFGKAKVDFLTTDKLLKEHFKKYKGINIATGFIASSGEGHTTTLGRNGSDYSASIIGAALNADVIEIWTDTDGVMTADPRFVKEAQTINQLSYNEAMELSHFGAKVIFPASLLPAMAKSIPVLVKNTFNPDHHGTRIFKESKSDNGLIKGITSLEKICLISIEGSGLLGVAGISARIFNVLSRQLISVVLISQASSEHSICIAVMQEDSEKACSLLKSSFCDELASGAISAVDNECDLAIVAVVGENMRHMPGVAARVFNPLGRNGINIKAISQGSSELNISFVIHSGDLKKTLRILHQSLFNKEQRQLHLYIAGIGSVGGRLLDMIDNHKNYLVKNKINLQICGVTNSRRMIIGTDTDDPKAVKSLTGKNSSKADLGIFVNEILAQNRENSVFIDATASDEPVAFYERLFRGNVTIVAANKRANSGSMNDYIRLHDTARIRNVSFHYETNVGAGLPVINVIRNLFAGGDKVIKIEAVLSGTMNWLFSKYDGSEPFSELVKIAMENGYTEPDPRDDLSGKDVARKCLILARECGLEMELEDIPVDALMPEASSKCKSINDFLEILREYDPVIKEKYHSASSTGKKLRYVASVENGKASVKLYEADSSNPFFSLQGSENCIILTTNYYSRYPMVIKGPGAGVDVTAAGLLADIVRIAEEVRI
jgi:bifunctional aspartokinase / homoserine dehydrogenase 1